MILSNYAQLAKELLETNDSISNIVITDSQGKILYQSEDWDVSVEIRKLFDSWNSKSQFIDFHECRYSTLQTTFERLIALNVKDQGYVIGAKSPMEIYVIAIGRVEESIPLNHSCVDVTRLANKIKEEGPRVPRSRQFSKYTKDGRSVPWRTNKREFFSS